jgi:hypothetical protein
MVSSQVFLGHVFDVDERLFEVVSVTDRDRAIELHLEEIR